MEKEAQNNFTLLCSLSTNPQIDLVNPTSVENLAQEIQSSPNTFSDDTQKRSTIETIKLIVEM